MLNADPGLRMRYRSTTKLIRNRYASRVDCLDSIGVLIIEWVMKVWSKNWTRFGRERKYSGLMQMRQRGTRLDLVSCNVQTMAHAVQ